MRLKNILLAFIIISAAAVVAPNSVYADAVPVTGTETPAEEAQRLERRLEEIRAMDTKHLSKAERKALRDEVKHTKKRLKTMSGGLYLSLGALIVIAVLLIILV